MADIHKPLTPFDIEVESPGVEVAVEPLPDEVMEGTIIEDDGEGGVVIDFAPQQEGPVDIPHAGNLAEHMDDRDLTKLGSELVQHYKDDKLSREPWEKAYIKGLNLLGLKIEERTQPWQGASGVFHPILTEAVVRFQADAMTETWPATGPVLTKVVGMETAEKQKQARRVQLDMNYVVNEVITECRQEHEQALFSLPLAGSAFKKVYYDYNLGRPTDRFVQADDFVVQYGASDLLTCSRYTHRMKMQRNDIVKAQYSGQYRMVTVPDAPIQYDNVAKKQDDVKGEAPRIEKDERNEILEVHVDLVMSGDEDTDNDGEETGIALPYIVTIDMASTIVLAIYRNWEEDDDRHKKLNYFIHYPYLPGLGFYGIGLVHMLGGLTKSATSILRQLVDAGTLSNLPAGLKARGLRIKGDDSPVRPGEFRDVDVPGGAIKDNITFLPYKEPSTVLYQLLGDIVGEARTIASIADMKISDMSQKAPVGTTLAIIERSMKVMSAVHARLHAAMRQEFKLLHGLVRDHMPVEYEYEVEEGVTRQQDYDDRIDVLPVSNPNASTMAQRIMQYQTVHQLSQTAPEIYDRKELHREMITMIGLPRPEKIVPLDDDMKPRDPVVENMAIITGKPVKAFLHQDHEAHIEVHMAAMKDPKILQLVAKSPVAKVMEAAMTAHLQEHLAFQYRMEIEKQLGVALPPPGEALPAEVEVEMSRMVAAAADKLLQKDQAEMEGRRAEELRKDPVVQMQQAEVAIKGAEVQRKAKADEFRAAIAREKLASEEKIKGLELALEALSTQAEGQSREETAAAQLQSKERIEGVKMGLTAAEKVMNFFGREGGPKQDENKS